VYSGRVNGPSRSTPRTVRATAMRVTVAPSVNTGLASGSESPDTTLRQNHVPTSPLVAVPTCDWLIRFQPAGLPVHRTLPVLPMEM
jgi:hypothetical protein